MKHLQWADVIIRERQVIVRFDEEVIVETCTASDQGVMLHEL